jgi:serine/threonine protein kinase/uncharacterized protein YjdB
MTVSLSCTQCGTAVAANDRYCPRCGAAQGTAAPRASASIELPAPDLVLEKLRRATLGSYEIRGELGRGGMAVVYLARDLRLDRSVAIKVMLPGLFLTQGMAERFLQEARIAARLYHPNIIIVHAVEQTDDLFYFVMNLVEGAAVDELLKSRSPLAIDEVRWILVQAARALHHAHGEGVVHRDVKPANLMINTKGDVIVSDFGIAKVGESSHLTRTGAAIGTPAYMSPEQVMGLEIGSASDQYSLGVAAFEMLTGRPPFGGAVLQIQWGHAHEAPPSIVSLRPDCPPTMADAVMRMLAKAPADRWPSLDPLVSVFAEGLPLDGGSARRALQASAVAIRGERAVSQSDALARTPLSPIPMRDASNSGARDVASASATLIRCSPQTVTLSAGETVTLRATVTDTRGVMLSQVPVQWVSSDEQIARVSARGDVVARRAGRAVIRATAGNATGESTITVEDAPIVRVAVTPPTVMVRVHDQQRVSARALDARGDVREGAILEWMVDDPNVATITSDGLVQGIAIGETRLRVRHGSIESPVSVTVRAPSVAMVRILPEAPSVEVGDATLLVAEAVDAVGNVLPARDAFWEIADARIATIDASGAVTGVSHGRVRVRATIDGVAVEKTVAVRAVPLASMSLRLSSDRVTVGDRVQLQALGRDVRGRDIGAIALPIGAVTSENPMVASIDADGTIVARGAGSTELRVVMAASPGTDPVGTSPISATLRLTVQPEPVRAITVDRDRLAVEVGDSVQLRSTVVGSTGDRLDRAVRWTTTDAAVVTVDDGLVTAIAPGTAEVRVSVDAITTAIPVTVSALSVAELRIEPTGSAVYVGDTLQLGAVAVDRTGARVPDAKISWKTNAAAILSVAPDGSARALAPGAAVVVASVGSVRATGQIAVDEVPVVSLRVSPTNGVLTVGATQELDIEAIDARGKQVSTLVMFTAAPSSVATVSVDGTVTARQPGSVLITASRGDLRAIAEFTVKDVPVVVEARTATPTPPTSAPSEVAASTATGSDAAVPPSRRTLVPMIGGAVLVAGAIGAFLLTRGGAPVSTTADSSFVAPSPSSSLPQVSGNPAPSESTPPPSGKPSATDSPKVAVDPAPEPPERNADPGASNSTVVRLSLRAPSTLEIGASATAQVTGFTSRGSSPMSASSVRWSSSNDRVATVSRTGVVTAVGEGRVTVVAAHADGATGRATVVVRAAPSVVVAPTTLPPTGAGPKPSTTSAGTPAPPAAPPTAAPTATPVPVAEASASDDDVSRVLRGWAGGLRKGSAPDPLKDFFGKGSEHAVSIADVAPGGKEPGVRQATATLVLSRTSFVGAPQRYRARVSATISGAGGAASLARVTVSTPTDAK